MCEFHESTGNGFGDIWWTDIHIYFCSIDSSVDRCCTCCLKFWLITQRNRVQNFYLSTLVSARHDLRFVHVHIQSFVARHAALWASSLEAPPPTPPSQPTHQQTVALLTILFGTLHWWYPSTPYRLRLLDVEVGEEQRKLMIVKCQNRCDNSGRKINVNSFRSTARYLLCFSHTVANMWEWAYECNSSPIRNDHNVIAYIRRCS